MSESMNESTNHPSSDLNPVTYTTFAIPSKDGERTLTGCVAVYYDDSTGTWVKVTINGVVRSYEQIEVAA